MELFDKDKINWEQVIQDAPEGATHVALYKGLWDSNGSLLIRDAYEMWVDGIRHEWCYPGYWGIHSYVGDVPRYSCEIPYPTVEEPQDIKEDTDLRETIISLWEILAKAKPSLLVSEDSPLYDVGDALDKAIKKTDVITMDELIYRQYKE